MAYIRKILIYSKNKSWDGFSGFGLVLDCSINLPEHDGFCNHLCVSGLHYRKASEKLRTVYDALKQIASGVVIDGKIQG